MKEYSASHSQSSLYLYGTKSPVQSEVLVYPGTGSASATAHKHIFQQAIGNTKVTPSFVVLVSLVYCSVISNSYSWFLVKIPPAPRATVLKHTYY